MHYNVAVILGPLDSLEDALAPFDENLEVEAYISRTRQDIINDAKSMKARIEESPSDYEDDIRKKYTQAKTDDELYQCMVNEYYEYDDEGNLLSTYNPNSRWDWWELGGRWSNKLKLKNGESADRAPLKNVDFSDNDEIYYEVLNWWKENVEGEDTASALSYSEKYTAEELARIRCKFYTCDVLVDGKWYSSDDFPSENDWIKEFYSRFIKGRNPNDIINIVDCHI